MNESPKALKAALRRQLYAEAKRHSAEERAIASQQICEHFRQQPVWQQLPFRSVLFFFPMAEEPDIRPLLQEALEQTGRLVALPRFDAAQGKYCACRIQDFGDVQPGYYGIIEPLAECERVELKELDLFLVPGVGFSVNGGRLGRGKGYYDLMLAEARGYKCGIAFDWQIVPALPLESHDIHLDCILTPTQVCGTDLV